MKDHLTIHKNHLPNYRKTAKSNWAYGLLLFFLVVHFNVFGQANIDNASANATSLMNRIEGTGVTLSNGLFPNPGDAGAQYGTFSDGIGGAGLSVDSGIILSTGSVTTALSSNDAAGSSENTGNTYSDPDLIAINSTGIYDAAIFQFDITTGADVDAIIISYQFGSEEYPDYVCSRFNDAFGFFVSGPGISGTQNIALVPESGNVVAVNSVNSGVCGSAQDGTATDLTKSNYFIDNNEGIPGSLYVEYNGMTTLLNGRIENLTPNTTYIFKIAIADVGDGSYDSGIIINQVVGYKSNADNDGLDDIVDVDDDNDGIDDIIEASGNEPNGDEDGDGLENWRDNLDNNGVGDGSVTVYADNNNDGFPDVYDTDNDGIPNHLDSDSDNDGCNDAIEAGHVDPDDDGVLGTSPVTSDANGRVEGEGGYTGTNSYVTTANTAGGISGQPTAESIYIGENASFSVTATGDNLIYQWQQFDGGAWSDLGNGGASPNVSGATTTTLLLTDVPLSYDGYDYRIHITSTSYACTDVISAEVNLEVLSPPSDAPVITQQPCVGAAATVTEISGSTTESITNLIIRIYTANTEGGAKTEQIPSNVIFSSGSWVAEGLSISTGQWVFATAENVDLGEPEGDFSTGIQVLTKTPDPTTSLKLDGPIIAGDTKVTGEVLVSTTSAYIIQLYIDGVIVPGATADVPQGALAVLGSWEITGLDSPQILFADGVATVTMKNPDVAFCESDFSNAVVIDCSPTNTIAIGTLVNPTDCNVSDGSIQFSGLTASTSYTVVYKKGGVEISSSLVANSSGEITLSGLNASSYSDIYVDLGACPSNILTGPFVLSDPTTATIFHLSNSNPSSCGGTDGSILIDGLEASLSYSVDYKFDGVAVNRTISSNGVNQLTIDNLSAGSYTNISVTKSQCTSNILTGPYLLSDPLSPSITYDSEQDPASCSATDGYIRLNGLIFNNDYHYQYTKDGSVVNSATPLTADADGVIQISSLGAGTYTNISVTDGLNSCHSNTIESIVLNPPDIVLGAISNPTTCAGTEGSIEIIGLAASTSYDLNYKLDAASVVPITISSDINGKHVLTGIGAGSYTDLTVTNNSCVSNALVTSLSDPTPATIAIGTTVNPTTCGGTNGSIEITGLAASTTYTIEYTLSGLVSQSYLSDSGGKILLTGLADGSYSNLSATLNNCQSNIIGSTVLSDPSAPDITLGANPEICMGAVSADLSYSGAVNSPDRYTLDFDAAAEAFGFVDLNNAELSGSSIAVTVPGAATDGVYNATIVVSNLTNSCASAATAFTITIHNYPGVPSITSQTNNDPTPVITGSADPGVSLEVDVAGATYNINTDGSGNWSVNTEVVPPNTGSFSPDLNGNNEVVVTANVFGCETIDVSSNELVIDTTPPTVDIQDEPSVIYTASSFTITISFSEDVTGFALSDLAIGNGFASNLTVVNGSTYTVDITPDLNGDVTIDVDAAKAIDAASNDNTAATQAVVPLAPTTPTVSSQMTNDVTPIIHGTTGTGAALEVDEAMTVEVNGATYNVTPDASGNWSVDTESDPIASGSLGTFSNGNSYEVIATVEDGGGYQAVDISVNEITIDTIDPSTPTVVSQVTNDITPVITGTTGTGTALSGDEAMTVTVNGATYHVTPDASGDWSVNTEIAPVALGTLSGFSDGNSYEVISTVTDAAGNSSSDATTDELTIDTTAPTITISTVSDDDIINALESGSDVSVSGTTTGVANGEEVTVTLNGIDYVATVTDDAWTLDIPSADIQALTEGDNEITANVSDVAGNPAVEADRTVVYDATVPEIPTIESQITSDATPVLKGTAEPGSTVSVHVGGAIFIITADTSGEWSVDTSVTPDSGSFSPNESGNNEVIVTSTDTAGNEATDVTALELTILAGDSDGDNIADIDEDLDGDGNPSNDDTDGDGTPDYLDEDDDGDGINTEDEDIDEDGNPSDDDTDGDGTPDYLDEDDDGDGINTEDEDIDEDGNPSDDDSDGDGTPDYLDEDDDGDGINTEDEDIDEDGNPSDDDTDGDGTPDYLDEDDDGDGINTEDEDIDEDGNPSDDDSDGDGTPDYLDEDDDGDGVNTEDEDIDNDGNPSDDDTDGDGTPDYLDEDDDGDGINTEDEDTDGNGNPADDDHDGDGTPDYLDTTDDRALTIVMEEQCINDVPYVDYEVSTIGFDPSGMTALVEWINANGQVVQTLTNQPLSGTLLWPGAEVDANGNGINWPGWDLVNGTWVQVEDGLRNGMTVKISVNPESLLSVSYPPATPACAAQPFNPFDDVDTDGDGISDNDEDIDGDGNPSNDDSDGDGTPDYLDEDDDNDGILTEDEDVDQDGDPRNDDTDGDGIADFMDTDDDGDGIATVDESGDCDRDGVPSYLDADPCAAPATVLNNVVSTSSPAPFNSLQIENIEDFPNNTVQIFNRWGNKVWETKGYDNNGNAFFGNGSGTGILGANGRLPVGTYFYLVDLGGGQDLIKGFVRVE